MEDREGEMEEGAEKERGTGDTEREREETKGQRMEEGEEPPRT